VYYSEAAALARENPAALQNLFVATLKRLSLILALPLAVAGVLAPWTFEVVFGAPWWMAGVCCSLLCPLTLLRVLAFVLGPTLDVIHRQDLRLVRELVSLILITAAIMTARWVGWSELAAVAATVASGCLGYSLSIALTWRALLSHRHESLKAEHIQTESNTQQLAEAA
jgi:O-antigen/teichoic acid export membrane protein